jgi:hypothetical protein
LQGGHNRVDGARDGWNLGSYRYGHLLVLIVNDREDACGGKRID